MGEVSARVLVALALAWWTFSGQTVQAMPLYENSLDHNAGFGWNSNAGDQQIVDKFTLASGADITHVQWYGFLHTPEVPLNFNILFFNDVFGIPADVDFFSTTVSNIMGVPTGLNNPQGDAIFEYNSAIPTVTLGAGDFWISIRASTLLPIWTWSHSATNGTSLFYARFSNTESWQLFNTNGGGRDVQAFALEGVSGVPEPTTFLLLLTAFAGLGFTGRRTKRQRS